MVYKEEHKLTIKQISVHFDVEIRISFCLANKLEACIPRHKPAIKMDENILLKDVEEFPDDY
ncbi:hypothetical protein BTN49_2564 [Candidatus Enterovibrio escicola]|uniref:Uncharacterized protein n=1 Tax=Candidatus Enterovibrio escicola TaxID=1927127 RepID=A0A2A5T181_9GAMM|nr:hypothetical protein BTN49_2564 [Candidatus Enterovibrio escacola]